MFWHYFLAAIALLKLALNEQPDTEWVGIAAGVFTSLALLPQLIKLIKNKKAEDISLFFLVILFCGLGLWVYYGFLRKDVPIIATNAFSLIINSIMIVLGIRYKARIGTK